MNGQKSLAVIFILFGIFITLLPVYFYLDAGGDSMSRIAVTVFPSVVAFMAGYLYYKSFNEAEELPDMSWRKKK